MVGLSVGTRPDCVDNNVLSLLNSFTGDYLVWVEYGLQSSHDITLKKINRGHDVKAFEAAAKISSESGLNVCAHVILGLPGETKKMMMETAEFLADQPIAGVKIHSLFVTKGTPLADKYLSGEFRCMEREEYIETLIDFLELLPPEYVIQRLTGDPYKNDMLAPDWALEKNRNIRFIKQRLEERNTWQGKKR
jgi:radical SAM protein (TIGR01212 family)